VRGVEQAGHEPQQRGFARAVVAHQAHLFTVINRKCGSSG
jgi:hypothetical protein